MRMIIFIVLLGFVLNVQAQEYRQLSWEEKLSEQYRYQFPNNPKPKADAQMPVNQRHKNHKMQAVLTQADKLAQQEATQARWERADYILLHQQQRRLEAQIDLYLREYPHETTTIQKYQTALEQTKLRKSQLIPYWTK